MKKIQNLREKKSTLMARDNHQLEDNTVHNSSSRQLTIHEESLLRRDSGFNLLHTARIEETEKTQVRQTVAMWLANRRSANMLLQKERHAMKKLNKDNSIIVLPADKGRPTVILNRSDYKLKALDLLNDRHLCRISTEGELPSHTRSANKALERLKTQGHLSQATYLQLKPKDRAIARFYGLPKVHKPNCPLRPIVALRDTGCMTWPTGWRKS